MRQQPLRSNFGFAQQGHSRVQSDLLCAFLLNVELQVVHQVFTHTGAVAHHLNPEIAQLLRRPNARPLEDDWRHDGSGRQDDFLQSVCKTALPVDGKLHADRTALRNLDFVNQRPGHHPHIAPRHGGPQVRHGSTATPAVAHVHLHGAKAFVLALVHIGGQGIARLRTGLHKCLVQRVFFIAPRHLDWAARAAQWPAARHGLQALEIGQHVGPAPPLRAQGLPQLVVHRVAAHPAHAVDGRRPAQALAAWQVHHAPVQARFGLRGHAPVEALRVHRNRQCRRHCNDGRAVAAAGLQHQNAQRRVFAETVGHHTSRRPGADHDVVVATFVTHRVARASQSHSTIT